MIRAGVVILLLASAAAANAQLQPVSIDRLLQTIRDLPERRSSHGSVEHWRGLTEAERIVQERFRALDLEPRVQPIDWQPTFVLRSGDGEPEDVPTFHNIIVELPGTDLSSEVLIVGAHLDAVPNAPGADDNGTGVAAVLEIARLLKDAPMRRTLRLIVFNLEETGLVGSRQYVSHELNAADPAITIIGMMSLEMLGYYSDEPGSQTSPIKPIDGVFDPPTVADFISIVGIKRHESFSRRLGEEMQAAPDGPKVLVVDFTPVPLPDMLRSDHAPFLLAGHPAVMVTDTANFRNPHYHRPTDTIDTLDPGRFAATVRGLVHAIHAISEPAIHTQSP